MYSLNTLDLTGLNVYSNKIHLLFVVLFVVLIYLSFLAFYFANPVGLKIEIFYVWLCCKKHNLINI